MKNKQTLFEWKDKEKNHVLVHFHDKTREYDSFHIALLETRKK